MAQATTKKTGATEEASPIVITELKRASMTVKIIGTSPLITNRMSQKTWFELLAPKKKTTADRANNLKHDPIKEFRDSPYIIDHPDALVGLMSSGFKKAMGTAALRIPGVKKTEISQLVYVPGEHVAIFGLPKVFMSIVRSADMNRTPDVRTRAVFPEWACELPLTWVTPALTETAILNLLQAAGFISGVGDWRQEKGSGSFGAFKLVTADDLPEWERIVRTQGRAAQQAAFADPQAYNDETSEMMVWFDQEIRRRGVTLPETVEQTISQPHVGAVAGKPKRATKANGASAH